MRHIGNSVVLLVLEVISYISSKRKKSSILGYIKRAGFGLCVGKGV